MFLNELSKRESILFINLVKSIATVDEVFSEKEHQLVADYLEELSLKDYDLEEVSFDQSLEGLKNSTTKNKNIIYFELVGLALVDGVYSEEELKLLEKISASLEISSEKETAFLNFFKEVKDLYDVTVVDYESKITQLEKTVAALLA
jgi:tellurite resistance protein